MTEKKVAQETEVKKMSLAEAIAEASKAPKKRKFSQTWDLSINVVGLDLKKPENRFSAELILPEGRGKELKVAIFSATMGAEAEKCADTVISKLELEAMIKQKKKLKKLVRHTDRFLAEASLMPLIGKSLGPILAPRGKMPKPLPPKVPPLAMVNLAKKSVRVMLKDSPAIHIPVGTDSMKPESVEKNAMAAYKLVVDKLPKGNINIKSVLIKLTMGKPMKVEMK